MKPKRLSLLRTVAAAVVTGMARPVQGKDTTPSPVEVPVQRPNTHSMLSFAESLLDKYGGRDASGRTHVREKLTESLEAMAKRAAREAEFETPHFTGQIMARCPKCEAQLYLGPVGAKDNCAGCGVMLEIHEGKIEPRNITYRYFLPVKPTT